MPSVFKAWLDHITVNGSTLSFNGQARHGPPRADAGNRPGPPDHARPRRDVGHLHHLEPGERLHPHTVCP
nr:hypothetical protein [Streptomyces caeruleatus]